MRRPRRPAQQLRFAVDCLPRHTREAMLEGIEANSIIVGAYTDRDGGVCPMLAAHRRGGRTSLVSFARAWDRYTRAGKRPRKASGREVRTLKAMIQVSLAHDDLARGELADAIADLEAIKARKAAEKEAASATDRGAEPSCRNGDAGAPPDGVPARRERSGTEERDRSHELSQRHGWAWLKVFRRYDEYEAALMRVEQAEREVDRREVERV